VETKANYVLIGLFALAGLGALLGTFLWFARVQLDQQFAYYDIRFPTVSGLSDASDVRFGGLPVGQVVDVRISEERDGTITVRIEVDAKTPVRADSVATVESLGVTGVSFVSIDAGTTDAPLLVDSSGGGIPEITSGRSTLQTLSEDAPELVSETLLVVREIGDLFRGENADRIERTLINAEVASEEFAGALEGFSGIASTVDQFTDQINRFNSTLDALTAELNVVLATANDTLISIEQLATETTVIVERGEGTLDNVDEVVSAASRYISEDLTATTNALQAAAAELRAELSAFGADAAGLIATFEETGSAATDRLRDAEVTLDRANTLLATLDTTAIAVEGAAARVDTLIAEEGAPLLAELRMVVADTTQAIAVVTETAQTDLPVMIADIRTAVTRATTVIDSVGTDLTTASEGVADVVVRADETLRQVTDTFANANTTLTAINGALVTGERTLVAAESALTGADALINDEITTLVEDLSESVDGLNAAIATVADDIPVISAEIRAASASASQAFGDLQGLVASSAPGVQEFTTQGLPMIARLAQETRSLIANLGQLTRQIERSPTQFLLDRDVPEFRR
jgi:phospholipid/cholesterol/gamma-HCH transport system substrate-binding protein